jgi:EpsI family protein
MVKNSRFITVYTLLIVVSLYINLHADIAIPMNRPFGEFPINCQEWRMISQSTFSESVLGVLKPTDYLSRQYADPQGKKINLYIGYHGGSKESGEIHSPKHCLPGSGWYEASTARMEFDAGGRKINLVKAVYQKGESKELFLYWFQVQEKTLSDEYSLKLAEITGSMLQRRRDAAFIRVSVPFEGDVAGAMATGVGFVRDFYPVIREFLPL